MMGHLYSQMPAASVIDMSFGLLAGYAPVYMIIESLVDGAYFFCVGRGKISSPYSLNVYTVKERNFHTLNFFVTVSFGVASGALAVHEAGMAVNNICRGIQLMI
jgi:hypothetical protein